MIQAFKMAMKSISGNKFRAFLTMLGIIIGVMALVILVSLVSGATGTVTDTISSLGSNLITVTVSNDKGAPVTLDTLDEWMADPQIGLAAPSATATATGKYSSTTKTVTVYGATPAYAPINGQTVLLGRFLTQADVENHTSVCIITEKTAEDMVGYTDCLGEEISLDGRKFTVVGIMKNDDESLTGILTKNSMIAYIPYTTLMRLSATVSSTITSFSVSAPEGGNMATTESAMKRLLLAAIRFYQSHISARTAAHCRFFPTCSAYAYQAIARYGALRGSALAAWRLLRCNPLFPGGFDPVPERSARKKHR